MKPIKSIYLPAFILLVACGSDNRDTSTADKESLGEVVLFDGKSLDGWKNYGGGKFFVEDGAIVGEAALKLPNSFLATETMYEDFDLQVEVLIDSLLNSGVQIRSNTYEKETKTIRWGGRFKDDGTKDVAERTWEAGRFWGYQVEIDPTDRAWSASLYEEGGRGFLHPPGEDKAAMEAFRPGEWNHFRVVAKGDHIQTWLNGVPVADVHDNLTKTGYIALQLHGIGSNEEKIGQKVRWRKFKLTRL